MKIVLAYLRILKKHDPNYPEHASYAQSAERFLATYLKFTPKVPHLLLIVNCGSEEHDSLFNAIAYKYLPYFGSGFDCGTYQSLASLLDCDLIVGLNTHAYFWRDDWLQKIADGYAVHGPGVYGVSASFENHPHLRTPCIAFHPEVMRQYPALVNSRQTAEAFESGPSNFALWAEANKFPVVLVTTTGRYYRPNWRKVKNGFRDGDQSEVLVRDRHTLLYDQATPEQQAHLNRLANGPIAVPAVRYPTRHAFPPRHPRRV